jgi:hypothetical protein
MLCSSGPVVIPGACRNAPCAAASSMRAFKCSGRRAASRTTRSSAHDARRAAPARRKSSRRPSCRRSSCSRSVVHPLPLRRPRCSSLLGADSPQRSPSPSWLRPQPSRRAWALSLSARRPPSLSGPPRWTGTATRSSARPPLHQRLPRGRSPLRPCRPPSRVTRGSECSGRRVTLRQQFRAHPRHKGSPSPSSSPARPSSLRSVVAPISATTNRHLKARARLLLRPERRPRSRHRIAHQDRSGLLRRRSRSALFPRPRP